MWVSGALQKVCLWEVWVCLCSAAKKKNIVRESRENESEMECDLRRESDRQRKARKRANESELDCLERRASDRQCTARRRANETEQVSVERRENNRQRLLSSEVVLFSEVV